MNTNVVFINQATGYLTIDIINAFAERIDEVALISGSIRVQDIPLNDNVQVSRISTYERGSSFQKLVSWIKGTGMSLYFLMTKYKDYDIFYTTVPPTAYFLSLLLRRRFSILVFDVYPDVLQTFNISQGNPVYRLWNHANKTLFKRSFRIYTLGAEMKELLAQYVSAERIHIIPNWSGLTKIKAIRKSENVFLQTHQLRGKFVIQYSGSIGSTHNVDVLIDIADRLRAYNSIFFLVIGRGARYTQVSDRIKSLQLQNCKILPYQPDEMLPHTLSAADLSVVILDEEVSRASMPSKIYNLQAVGSPVLSISAADSELAKHVNKYHNGKNFSKDNIDGIVEYILKLRSDESRLKEMSHNSIKAAKNFTICNAKRYVDIYLNDGVT